MARWDNILTLPVQEPSSTEFSASDLLWYKVEGWRQNIDDVALIPFARVDDFVKGESSNAECPTKFRVEARRRKAEGSSCKPRVDGYLEYILYWCSYGPDDHRTGGTSRPSRRCIKPSMKKSPAGRPHTKRGCMCHFIVKRLCAQPSVALIIYNQQKHVDKNGSPCHGSLDNKAIGTPAMFAPFISEELRQRITSLLYLGYSVESIMENHAKFVERQGGPNNRDDLVTLRFVRTLERDIRRSSFELHPDDKLSIKLWVENHQNQVFYYQDSSETSSFILGIQTEWQLQQMIRFGNNSMIALDSSLGTKTFKYPVSSLLVFDSNNIAIPIAWVISASTQSYDVGKWMHALCERVHERNSNWKLDGFILDDILIDSVTVRESFKCSVLLCFWRVRSSWHKNVLKKCANVEIQRVMFKRLGQLMECTCSNSDVLNACQEFMEDFIEHRVFLDYFKERWISKLEDWAKALKVFPIASQEASAIIEAYHFKLKSKLSNEEDISLYQRVDWLAHKLSTAVHSYYWFDNFTEENDLCGYMNDQELSSTSWHKALYIPDGDVILGVPHSEMAKVVSQSNRSHVYTVWNPGSEFSFCDCSWFMSGRVCKHMIKVNMVWWDSEGAKPSMALQTYHKSLSNLLSCPSNGSLVLDQAIVLAINMHQDLKRLLGLSSQTGLVTLSPYANWVCKRSRTPRHRKRVIGGHDFSQNDTCSNNVINAMQTTKNS